MPKFSVIIPTYNNSKSLPQTIRSVLDQSFVDWEMLIIDDGSTDETEAYVQSYLNDPRINYIKQQNLGVSIARNMGTKNASGNFITFLDADDVVTKIWLSDFQELMQSSSNPGYLSCGYYINKDPKFPKVEFNISKMPYSSLAGAFAIKREILEKIEGYDTNLKQSENWELTARALFYCERNGMEVLHTKNCNFFWNHNPTPEQTLIRDEYRAEATFYLFHKYKESGVFHYRKDDFLVSSGVNFARAGRLKKSRKIFCSIFFEKPSIKNFLRIITLEIPALRQRKWGRNL